MTCARSIWPATPAAITVPKGVTLAAGKGERPVLTGSGDQPVVTLSESAQLVGIQIETSKGVGVAVVPELAALRLRRRLALVVVRLADPWAVRRLVIGVRRLSALSPHARRLVEHLLAAGSPT